MNLLSRFVRLSVVGALCAPFFSIATTFVPISVGDITIIIPVNNVPEAKNDLIANIPERHVDLDVPVTVIDNDEDENPSTLTVTLVSQTSANGQPLAVATDNQTIIYTTLPGWNGTDTFQYRVTDDEGQQSDIATATVTFVDANDPPVATTDRFVVLETDTCNVNSASDFAYRLAHCRLSLGNIFANDVDDGGVNAIGVNQILLGSRVRSGRNFFGDGLTYYQASGESFVYVEPNGDLFYLVHPATFNTSVDFIDYTVVDSEGLVSNVASIIFDIEGRTAPILPTVTAVSPTAGSFIAPSESVVAQALASDTGGSIRRVEFSLDRGETWRSDTTAPYEYDFGVLATGDYVMLYRAIDNSNNESDQISVPFAVGVKPNALPVLTSTGLSSPAPYDTDSFIVASATASDSDGLVYAVEFRLDGGAWISDDTLPYGADFGLLSAGVHRIDYRAKDNVGEYSAVEGVTFEVVEAVNEPPSIRSASPANGTSYVENESVIAAASAEDTDGFVSSVSFRLNGGTWLTDTTSPYGYDFGLLPVGLHTIDYLATDDEGGESAIVSRTVEVTAVPNEAPTVSVTSPTSGDTYLSTQSVEVAATAQDSDGTIALVEARVDGGPWKPVTQTPYTIDVGRLAPGARQLEVRSRDDDGEYSAVVSIGITVNVPPRRIIYIHTDALGSPAAETNENGVNQ